jgi:hypothetical protein
VLILREFTNRETSFSVLKVQAKILKVLLYFLLFAGIAELACRIDDHMRYGTNLLEPVLTADSLKISDLTTSGVEFKRGKPFARYRTWVLNEHGFRSQPFEKEKTTGRPRVMVLGASESFGFAESPGKPFADRLEMELKRDFQIVNASIIGMPLWAMAPYWENWLADFDPDIVIVVASPLFYLSNHTPSSQIKSIDPSSNNPKNTPSKYHWLEPASFSSILENSRFIDRLKNKLEIPQPIAAYRQRKRAEQQVKLHGPDWVITVLPEDRVALYRNHLVHLIDKIQSKGGKVILTTCPIIANGPNRPNDQKHWLSDQEKRSKFTNEVKWKFLEACRQAVLEIGHLKQIPVLDLWEKMTGEERFFYDLNHFSDLGSEFVAERIISQIRKTTIGQSERQLAE